VLHCFSPFKSSLHLLFFLLAPRSECLRVSLACLRDDRLTVFVTLALTNRALALSRNRLISGYDIGPMFERSNNPTQSLKERPQFIWSGKRYRTNIFRSSTVGNLANNQPAILRIRTRACTHKSAGTRSGYRLAASISDGSKPDVRRTEIDFLRLPRSRTVARAIIGGAEI
jgi:hypothetical protein